jgi:hypothetical protein
MLVFVKAAPVSTPEFPKSGLYPLAMARGPELSRPRPRQGARPTAFRQAAELTQVELARLIGEKPPRSDVLPKLAKVLGVRVEALLG